jgi:hypothetical protein
VVDVNRSRTQACAVGGIFPSLLPDELFYSAAARFQELMQFRSATAVREALFGSRDITTVVDLPGHLQQFVDRLPHGHLYPVSDLIRKHTLFPFYAPFTRADRASAAFELLRESAPGVHRLLNVTGSAVAAPKRLRYCLQCAASARNQFGTAYWHRLHQVPGVVVCPEHEAPLYESRVERRSRMDRYGYHSLSEAEVQAGMAIQVSDASLEHHIRIAREAEWLLASEPFTVDLPALRSAYRRLAHAKGWIDSIDRLMTQALERALLDYYGTPFFTATGIAYDRAGSGDTWASRVFQLPIFFHAPMRHLVMMGFLGMHASELLSLTHSEGDTDGEAAVDTRRGALSHAGPPVPAAGPCRNPLCSQFDSKGVQSLSAISGGPRQIFVQCPICRFAYWYDANCPGMWGMVETGDYWDTELRRLVLETRISQGRIAKSLGVSSNLLMRLAWEKGITRPRWLKRKWSEPRRTGERGISEAKQREHRSTMTKLLELYPSAARVELRSLNPTAYAWLDRHDLDWLESVLPERRPPGGNRSDVWIRRDEALLHRIPEAVATLLTAGGRPRRVTLKSIADQLGMGTSLRGMIDNIPRSRALIERRVESDRDIALRRIRWAAAQFVAQLALPSTAYILAKHAGYATISEVQRVCDLQAEYDRTCAEVRIAAEKMGVVPAVCHR